MIRNRPEQGRRVSPRRRPKVATPRAEVLEAKQLLTVSADWFGLDNVDLVGSSTAQVAPDGQRDLHIKLVGLPNKRIATIDYFDTFDPANSAFQFREPGAEAVTTVRSNLPHMALSRAGNGSTTGPYSGTADVYVPYSRDVRNSWSGLTLTFWDGSKSSVSLAGLTFQPNGSVDQATYTQIAADGSDLVSFAGGGAATPDGVQDVHLRLDNLPNDRIGQVEVVYDRGDGAPAGRFDRYVYTRPGFAGDTSGPAGSLVFQRAGNEVAGAALSSTADLYLPAPSKGGQNLTVRISYTSGAKTTRTFYRDGLITSALPIAATSKGQVAYDVARVGTTTGPDGIQDSRFTVDNLGNKTVARIDLFEGAATLPAYQYVNPAAIGNLPTYPLANAISGRVFGLQTTTPGVSTMTADGYFQVNSPITAGTTRTYRVLVTYADGTSAATSMTVQPTDTLRRFVTENATVLGQDGSDFANNGTRAGADSIRDQHLRLGNLPALAIAKVDVYLGNTNVPSYQFLQPTLNPGATATLPAIALARTNNANPGAGLSTTADLYFQVAAALTNASLKVVVTYQGGSYSTLNVNGVNNVPNLPVYTTTATSLGQDGSDQAQFDDKLGSDGYADLHLRLQRLPNKPIANAVIYDSAASDGSSASGFLYQYTPKLMTSDVTGALTGPNAAAMSIRRSADGTSADVYLQWAYPASNGYRMRVDFSDGTSAVVALPSVTVNYTARAVQGDYTGDGKAEVVGFYASTASLIRLDMAKRAGVQTQFGQAGRDIPLMVDFDGDGRTDLANFRRDTSEWIMIQSSQGVRVKQFGMGGSDQPVAADYDGDGVVDLAVFRPGTAEWFVLGTKGTPYALKFGIGTWDVPVPGDYDGRGVTQMATFRTTTGEFLIRRPVVKGSGYATEDRVVDLRQYNQVHESTDIPVPFDYDGDTAVDVAIYRPTTGKFVILPTSTNVPVEIKIPGLVTNRSDVPVVRDYDGDGRGDVALFRPSNATFYILNSTTGKVTTQQFGVPGQTVAVAGRYGYRMANSLRGRYASGISSPSAYAAATLAGGETTIVPPPSADLQPVVTPRRHPRPTVAFRY